MQNIVTISSNCGLLIVFNQQNLLTMIGGGGIKTTFWMTLNRRREGFGRTSIG